MKKKKKKKLKKKMLVQLKKKKKKKKKKNFRLIKMQIHCCALLNQFQGKGTQSYVKILKNFEMVITFCNTQSAGRAKG